MTNLNQKINLKDVSQPFFGEYKYRFSFHAPGITILRDFKFKKAIDIDEFIAQREFYTNYHLKMKNFGGAWRFETVDRELITKIYRILKENANALRLHVSMNWATVYTNNLDLYYLFNNLDELKDIEVTKANVVRPAGSVVCARSPHSTRTYFQDRIFDSIEQKQQLARFLLNQKDIRLSPSLKSWCNKDYQIYRGIFKHYFIDHSDERILVLLELSCPNVIRKSVDIIKGK